MLFNLVARVAENNMYILKFFLFYKNLSFSMKSIIYHFFSLRAHKHVNIIELSVKGIIQCLK